MLCGCSGSSVVSHKEFNSRKIELREVSSRIPLESCKQCQLITPISICKLLVGAPNVVL